MTVHWICEDYEPDKERQNDNPSKKVIDDEEYGIALRCIGLRLLVLSRYTCSNNHNVNPSLERDNFEENEKRRLEIIE